jgi:glycosyltransferase involved in cell wall biosynthesis
MKNICHITTVHPRYDTRIFLKECISLNKLYKVHLIVADGLGNEVKNGVFIYDVGLRQKSRLKRARIDSRKAFKKAVKLNCDLYHFHDPELIPISLKIKKIGKKVIFDAHEDLPRQILSKPYLNKALSLVFSKIISFYESYSCPRFDYIIAATPFIRTKFLKINSNSEVINNFPILGELSNNVKWSDKKNVISFVGGITKIRGIKELLEAIKISEFDFKLKLIGEFSPIKFKEELGGLLKNEKVNFLGYLIRIEVASCLKQSKIGIVTFLPSPNHIDSQPNKMFEYMSAGIPVVSSNFPLWKEIVEGNNCGLTVDPKDPKEISGAIEKLLSNDKLAEEMGQNGKKAIFEKYNWGIEEKKLLNIYKKILK